MTSFVVAIITSSMSKTTLTSSQWEAQWSSEIGTSGGFRRPRRRDSSDFMTATELSRGWKLEKSTRILIYIQKNTALRSVAFTLINHITPKRHCLSIAHHMPKTRSEWGAVRCHTRFGPIGTAMMSAFPRGGAALDVPIRVLFIILSNLGALGTRVMWKVTYRLAWEQWSQKSRVVSRVETAYQETRM